VSPDYLILREDGHAQTSGLYGDSVDCAGVGCTGVECYHVDGTKCSPINTL